MRMIDDYNKIKTRHNKSIILIKSGIFYETFNDDSYIMSYLFNYKIKELSNCIMVGFPEKVINSIKERLEKEGISYVIIEDEHKFLSDKNSHSDSNYDILFDISFKDYKINGEIESVKKKLEILKSTKSINEIISKIKDII